MQYMHYMHTLIISLSMLNTKEVNKLAKILGWKRSILNSVLMDFFESNQEVNWKLFDKKFICDFFRLLINENNPSEIENNFCDLFLKNFDNINIVKAIAYLMDENEFVPNFLAYYKLILLRVPQKEPYFIPNKYDPKLGTTLVYSIWFENLDYGIDSFLFKLRENLVERTISYYYRNNSSKKPAVSYSNFILELAKLVGFNIFDIESIRESIIEQEDIFISYKTLKKNKFYDKIINSLIIYQKEVSIKRHWIIYFYVEELKEMGYGTRESFRIVGKIFKEKSTSVHRRYYDKLKEIKEKRLVIDDIIEKYHIPNKSYILRHIRLQKQLNKF